jgi:hypothetical protein
MITYEYLAGLFDGEGTIGLYKHKGDYGRGWNFEPMIRISNTNKEALKRIQEEFGGYYREKKFKDMNTNWKTPCEWNFTTKLTSIKPFLESLYPFLIIKKKQAGLMIEFCDIRIPMKRKRTENGKFFATGYQYEYTPRMDEIYEELKLLNKRGI